MFSLSLSHLWCHKVGGVTGGQQQAVSPPKLLGEAKVTDPDGVRIPGVIHVEDVAGFQVSMYHLWRFKSTFTLQVLMFQSDFVLAWTFLYFKCDLRQTPVWTLQRTDVTRMHRKWRDVTFSLEVNVDAMLAHISSEIGQSEQLKLNLNWSLAGSSDKEINK